MRTGRALASSLSALKLVVLCTVLGGSRAGAAQEVSTLSRLTNLMIPRSGGTRIAFEGRSLKLSGSIAVKDPCEPFGSFFRSVHEAARGERVSELVVDVSQLTFVNSSAIRLFVDWATWLKSEGIPYKLVFRSRRSVAWQRTAFLALQSLVRNVLDVEYVS